MAYCFERVTVYSLANNYFDPLDCPLIKNVSPLKISYFGSPPSLRNLSRDNFPTRIESLMFYLSSKRKSIMSVSSSRWKELLCFRDINVGEIMNAISHLEIASLQYVAYQRIVVSWVLFGLWSKMSPNSNWL